MVEDEADIADALGRFLRADGHAVDHAPDLDGAEAALDFADYDAILLDLAQPDGSGLTLLRDQRRRGNRVPVIIATARDQISERIAGLDAGRMITSSNSMTWPRSRRACAPMAGAPRAIRRQKAGWDSCGSIGQARGCSWRTPKSA